MSEIRELERCYDCDEPTGRAGRGDDSLYCEYCDKGPFCPDCFNGHSLDCCTAKLATALERLEKLEKDNAVLQLYSEFVIGHDYGSGFDKWAEPYLAALKEADGE